MDPSAPAGLVYRPDFVSIDEEARLIATIETIAFEEVHFRGVVAKRTVRHFGYRYEYNARRAVPTDPVPADLEWLRLRCAGFAEVESGRLVECLVTRYPPGAGIGWHRDAPMFGSRVVGVSLGAPCRMRFRRETKTHGREDYALNLEPRSAYIFSGAARWSWQHHIPGVDGLRYSVTFRTFRGDKED